MRDKGILITRKVYHGLIHAYAKTRGKAIEAEKILREMEQVDGLTPDIVCFTSVINAYAREDKIEECWRVFDEARIREECDELLYSFMIRLCAKTSEAEMAMKLY